MRRFSSHFFIAVGNGAECSDARGDDGMHKAQPCRRAGNGALIGYEYDAKYGSALLSVQIMLHRRVGVRCLHRLF